ncbi:hypothetical protein HID58_048517, partial [Brassica napus]
VQPVLNLPHSRANLNLRFLWCCFIFFLTIRETISYRFILLNPPPTIYLESDLHARPWNCDYKKTGRVRHNRRRKAVATEERRIKAMRDQPCPATLIPVFIVFPPTSDWVLCFTLISLGFEEGMVEFIGLLKMAVKEVVNSNLNPVCNQELMMSVPKSYGPMFGDIQIGKWLKLHDNPPIDDNIINIVDGKVKHAGGLDQASGCKVCRIRAGNGMAAT